MAYDKRQVFGGMNMDDALEVLPNGSVRFARNMHIREKALRQNLKGNSLVTNIDIPLETFGTYICIGAIEEPKNNYIIFFLFHSGLDHRILQYHNKTNSITTVLREQPVGCLNFDYNYLITGINIVYYDANNPLLYWTDDKNRPRELNIESAKLFSAGTFTGYYSSPFLENFIDAIKYPPLYPPTRVYDTDTTRITNNLTNKMFEFQYRYIYFNGQKSAFSPISKTTIPQHYSNLYLRPVSSTLLFNVLLVSGVQGANNVAKIEIAAREGNVGTFYSIAIIDRVIGTALDTPFTYNFYNEEVKLPLDIKESIKLFDSLPLKAKAQEFISGNRIAYGNVVPPLFDNVPIDVELTPIYNERITSTVAAIPTLSFASYPIGNPPVFGVDQQGVNADANSDDGVVCFYTLDFTGYVPVEGDVVKVDFDYRYEMQFSMNIVIGSSSSKTWNYPDFRSEQNNNKIIATIMVRNGEILSDVLTRLTESLNTTYSYLNPYYKDNSSVSVYTDVFTAPYEIHNQGAGANDNTQGIRLFKVDGDTIIMADATHDPAQTAYDEYVAAIIAGATSVLAYAAFKALQVAELAWNVQTNRSQITTPTFNSYSSFKAGAQHQFGIVYKDNAGRLGATNVNDNCVVKVDWYNTASETGKIDIGWEVKSLPPDWAVAWCWVYTGSSIADFHQIPITNTITYTLFNGIKIYPHDADSYLISYEEINDYIRAVRTTNPVMGAQTGENIVYQWVQGDRVRLIGQCGAVFAAPTNYVDAEITGVLIKEGVHYLSIRQSPDVIDLLEQYVMVEIYRNKINSNVKLYYEFGEEYPILNAGLSNRSHGGQIQNQDPTQPIAIPATGTFVRGDIYFKERIVVGSFGTSVVSIEDYNWLDYAPTANYDKGRPNRVVKDIKQARISTMIPFSGRFIENTNINKLNSFYDTDFEEYDQAFGSIQKLAARDKALVVYQELKTGNIRINERLVVTEGAQILATTDDVLNPMIYYAGDFGIGKNPECWAKYGYADYFVDVFRGVICRLSVNGIDPISYLYKVNDYVTSLFKSISAQGGRVNIYGVFNKQRMQYEITIDGSQTSGAIDSVTLAFDEKNNVFTSFFDYLPEMMVSINQNIGSFKAGRLWTHETNVLHNNFYGIQYDCEVWVVGNINPSEEKVFLNISQETNSVFSVAEFTNNKGQISSLETTDFENNEGIYYAKLLMDENTPNVINPLLNGDDMRDVLIVAKLKNTSTNLVSLFAINFNSTYSARSNR